MNSHNLQSLHGVGKHIAEYGNTFSYVLNIQQSFWVIFFYFT